jgi:hypothetical protein
MMIPSTREELRETLRGWPLHDLRKAIRGALPELDDGLVAGVAHWLAAKRAIVPALVDLPVLP